MTTCICAWMSIPLNSWELGQNLCFLRPKRRRIYSEREKSSVKKSLRLDRSTLGLGAEILAPAAESLLVHFLEGISRSQRVVVFTVISDSKGQEIIGNEIKRRNLVPGSWSRLTNHSCIIARRRDLELVIAVIGKVGRNRRGTETLPIHFDQSPGRLRSYCDTTAHAPGLNQGDEAEHHTVAENTFHGRRPHEEMAERSRISRLAQRNILAGRQSTKRNFGGGVK